ncbi:putative TIM-barrel protein, nifR3 family [Marinitoga hydrogenitolerans DSM 16785]|uniref:tRNA-dihydrouridine synthase n=1 Tax=Marinitoga hydrogenitolerans (strain DSM 16785 / JCM 12826 / AT1271) TaxID=1122195 RepID=A0A1M4ZUC1_MARH1|nr:tRNA-dihydrouridine synthase family protein [Marinitoga hydrogenitolerans]SHF21372.1 putative TIM-barrel protein, nifR3 family [Marinitoga hydrogenitolerans DSM 16785]
MLNGKIGLAPMADYTDFAYREICREYGAEFTFTEMISIEALVRNKSFNMFPKEREKNIGIQLFGSNVDSFIKAGLIAQHYGDWIDINAGCPVKKVIKKGAGSALLKDLNKLGEIIRELKRFLDVPVGVKVRLGFEDDIAEKIIETIQKNKADYVIVHTRTQKQLYSGKANWKRIRELKRICEIPLGASGDIYTYNDAKILMNKYEADFAIIARGSIGNPWIFSNKNPDIDEIKKTILKHVKLMIDDYGEERTIRRFKKIFIGYTKGLKNAREIRNQIPYINSYDDLEKIVNELN